MWIYIHHGLTATNYRHPLTPLPIDIYQAV